ncbi:MAG: 4Fe-4S dicluster domain-containing protein [Phycisphaerae bacterium]|nr:4Fe-4S dicluster domain-containing protein [Gammaproteobacteria bacterium]NIS16399.1 4Fe-4S dicluster domain-containing protein [candidate division Zixibacteria bacterium]NIU59201.1 4Fe-4S dicluster domain-containing protein [Phycisphaerae bacterium]NIW95533.1 4Fe-4S dicluster domain-containing protein [Phycisphaerae bacterium]
MIKMKINGIDVGVEEGSTVLEAAQFLGFPIPTLCHMEGLTPYGACRLCVVEIGNPPRSKLVSSCTYPAEDGLVVRTASERVMRARKMIIELLLASCPQSKVIQDLASKFNVRQQRFKQEYEDCILCGLCVRMCEEQMMAKAIGFRGRGENRSIGTPFDIKSEVCRQCGGCIYVCPACQLRCTYNQPEKAICGGCANLAPPCIEKENFHDMMCYMDPCVACEIREENN